MRIKRLLKEVPNILKPWDFDMDSVTELKVCQYSPH